jgi:SAM-dependent methyltransferase
MADPASSATDPLQAVRDSYEGSLSWRVTAPLRAARQRLGPPPSDAAALATALTPSAYDLPLLSFWDERLAPIERELVAAGPDAAPDRSLFRGLPDAVWGMLLTQRQRVYPAIAAALPSLPHAELQRLWNGPSGPELIAQTTAFYQLLKRAHGQHGTGTPLERARVLDFGCGWGRLTRFLERDVIEPGALCGVDPVQGILDEAVRNGVRADLRRCGFVPEQLPFEQPFELAYAFSVFTHLSEAAHLASLRALHAAVVPGGLLVATIRPPEYLRIVPSLRPALESLGPDRAARLVEPRYLYAPHPTLPLQGPGDDSGAEVSYGETVVTIAYVRERWSELFELVTADVSLSDPHQVALLLRRR